MITKDEFQEMLDNTYPDVVIVGIPFLAGRALRKLDPVAFDEMYYTTVHSWEEESEDEPLSIEELADLPVK